MRKLVRLSVVIALVAAAQVGFAAGQSGPQPPQPVPPILQPYPGPNVPGTGPVDPTPVLPPVSGS